MICCFDLLIVCSVGCVLVCLLLVCYLLWLVGVGWALGFGFLILCLWSLLSWAGSRLFVVMVVNSVVVLRCFTAELTFVIVNCLDIYCDVLLVFIVVVDSVLRFGFLTDSVGSLDFSRGLC